MVEAAGYEWARERIGDWLFPAEPIAMALLAGEGPRVAAGYARAVRSSTHPALLVEVPGADLTALECAQLGWLALLRGEWAPLPARSGDPEYALIAELLAAAAAGDDERRLEAAVAALVAEYDPPEDRYEAAVSPLEAGLRRALAGVRAP